MESPEFIINRWKKRGFITFVHVGKFEQRKSTVEIMRAFRTACEATGVQAMLKMMCNNPFDNRWMQDFLIERADFHSIECVETGPANDEGNLAHFYRHGDFGLYASKGEAFGLPIVEGIACGLPTITSNWSGMSEYLKDYPAELLLTKYTKEIANDGKFFKGGQGSWCVPDQAELVEAIKFVLINAEDIYKRLRQPCVDAVSPFTWQNAVEKLGI